MAKEQINISTSQKLVALFFSLAFFFHLRFLFWPPLSHFHFFVLLSSVIIPLLLLNFSSTSSLGAVFLVLSYSVFLFIVLTFFLLPIHYFFWSSKLCFFFSTDIPYSPFVCLHPSFSFPFFLFRYFVLLLSQNISFLTSVLKVLLIFFLPFPQGSVQLFSLIYLFWTSLYLDNARSHKYPFRNWSNFSWPHTVDQANMT